MHAVGPPQAHTRTLLCCPLPRGPWPAVTCLARRGKWLAVRLILYTTTALLTGVYLHKAWCIESVLCSHTLHDPIPLGPCAQRNLRPDPRTARRPACDGWSSSHANICEGERVGQRPAAPPWRDMGETAMWWRGKDNTCDGASRRSRSCCKAETRKGAQRSMGKNA